MLARILWNERIACDITKVKYCWDFPRDPPCIKYLVNLPELGMDSHQLPASLTVKTPDFTSCLDGGNKACTYWSEFLMYKSHLLNCKKHFFEITKNKVFLSYVISESVKKNSLSILSLLKLRSVQEDNTFSKNLSTVACVTFPSSPASTLVL